MKCLAAEGHCHDWKYAKWLKGCESSTVALTNFRDEKVGLDVKVSGNDWQNQGIRKTYRKYIPVEPAKPVDGSF